MHRIDQEADSMNEAQKDEDKDRADQASAFNTLQGSAQKTKAAEQATTPSVTSAMRSYDPEGRRDGVPVRPDGAKSGRPAAGKAAIKKSATHEYQPAASDEEAGELAPNKSALEESIIDLQAEPTEDLQRGRAREGREQRAGPGSSGRCTGCGEW